MNIEEIQGNLTKYKRNYEWFSSNYEKLKEKYPNEFVAIDDGKVIAYGKNIEELERKGIENPSIFIGIVQIDDLVWIL